MNHSADSANPQINEALSIWITRFLWISFFSVLILAIGSLTGQYLVYFHNYEKSTLINLLDMDRELSIPSLVTTFLLFGITILLEITTLIKIAEKDRQILKWGVLTLGFLYIVFDEGASIHELLMNPIHNMLLYVDIPSIFYFTWVIPGIIIVLFLAVFFVKFVIDLPGYTRNAFLLSGLIYVGGALGIELISGYFAGQYGMQEFGFEVLATIEETLEMLGLTLFLHSLLVYLRKNYRHLQIQII